MVDFRSKSKTPNYLSRGFQRRMLLLAGMVILVVVLISEIRQPVIIPYFLAPMAGEGQRPIDTVLRTPAEDEEPDLVIIRRRPPDGERPDEPGKLPGVHSEDLAGIRDDTPFRASEHAAFFGLLDVLRQTPLEEIHAVARPVAFVQLYPQIKEYRGEVVLVTGTLMRNYEVQAPRNEFGIKRYYQMWVRPDDDRTQAIVVYSLDAAGQPLGLGPNDAGLNIPIQVAGIVFKRWAYPAQEAIVRTTPMLLARTIEPQPIAVEDEIALPSLQQWAMIIVGCAAAAGLFVIYAMSKTSKSKSELSDYARRYLKEGQQAPSRLDFAAVSKMDKTARATPADSAQTSFKQTSSTQTTGMSASGDASPTAGESPSEPTRPPAAGGDSTSGSN